MKNSEKAYTGKFETTDITGALNALTVMVTAFRALTKDHEAPAGLEINMATRDGHTGVFTVSANVRPLLCPQADDFTAKFGRAA